MLSKWMDAIEPRGTLLIGDSTKEGLRRKGGTPAAPRRLVFLAMIPERRQ